MDELIRLLKNAQGLFSQNEFAEKCGISSSNLTRIYRNNQRPSPELLKKIGTGSGIEGLYEKLMVAAGYWESTNPFVIKPELFRARLKELRRDSGESLEELSIRSGYPVETLMAYESGDLQPSSIIEIIGLARAFDVFSDYLSGADPYKNEDEYSDYVSRQETLICNLDRLPDQISKEVITSLNRLLRMLLPTSEVGDRALQMTIPHLKAVLDVIDDIHSAYLYCLRSGEEDQEIDGLRIDYENEQNDTTRVKNSDLITKYIMAHFGQRDVHLLSIRQSLSILVNEVEEQAYRLFKENSPVSCAIMRIDED